MKRREFIAGLFGAVAGPLAARTQPNILTPRIGLLMPAPADGIAAALTAFRLGLKENRLDPEKDVRVAGARFKLDQELGAFGCGIGRLACVRSGRFKSAGGPRSKAGRTSDPHRHGCSGRSCCYPIGDKPRAARRPCNRPVGLSARLCRSPIASFDRIAASARCVGFLHNPDAPTASLTY